MKKILKLKRIYLLGLFPFSLTLIFIAKNSSYFAEQIYAKHLYKWVSQIISTISGFFPFSITELIVIGLPIISLLLFLRFIVRVAKDKQNRSFLASKGILNFFCMISIALFLFIIFGGLNYYRYPFSHYSDLEITDSSVEDLYNLTQNLAMQANELRGQAENTDNNGVFQLSANMYRIAGKADNAMTKLSKTYPILAGNYGSPKPILLSAFMSKTEITGLFFPFTMEANVNIHVPDYSIPATMLHELAHLRGFMREDEANFIAYLAGMESEDAELQYSSTMLALVTAGNALYDQDKDLYFKIRSQFSEEVIKDIRDNSSYWQQFDDTAISTLSNQINDTYLKVNAQSDGVQSYGRMLDLLLAKYKQDSVVMNEPK